MSGKKVSGTFCAKHPKGEFPARGTGNLFLARSLEDLEGAKLWLLASGLATAE